VLRVLPRQGRRYGSVAAALAQLVLALLLALDVAREGTVTGPTGYFRADALNTWLLVTMALIGACVAMYSLPYIRTEREHGNVARGLRPWYEPMLHASMALLTMTLLTSDLGLIWIGMEAATIVTAFLVAFYREDVSLEAAWKYLLLSSVGITLGFFGTILVYYSSLQALGASSRGLDWATLQANAGLLDPDVVRLSFVFVLIGYGTKAGLAPMHTWLPDAHSQAPAPVSALLSAMFLNASFYGLLRFHGITNAAVPGFSGPLLIAFGLLSLLVAVPFIIAQRDYKRLFAYSSVEHMGIAAIGFGLGGSLATFAALLHMVNHAIVKAALFFTAGNLDLAFSTRRIEAVQGVAASMPATGAGLLLGALAITGAPPFSLFVSEFLLLTAAVQQGQLAVAAIVILALVVVFGGFMAHAIRMGHGPREGPEVREPSRLGSGVILALLGLSLLFGLWLPAPVQRMAAEAARVLVGA
jgi:hydrogenase-4 component F